MPDRGEHVKRWRRVEYDQLVDRGVFAPGERLELIDGALLVAEPQTAAHFAAVRLAALALSRAFGPGWDVRALGPIALDADSEPQPDVAVVRGEPRDFVDAHPAAPVLVVEVALGSLGFDREQKSSLYARARRPEYWIVNLLGRVLEVRREPVPSVAAAYGWDYRSIDILGVRDGVRPLAVPGARVEVADLLP